MEDPHNYKQRLERAMIRLEDSALSQRNKVLITKFKDDCLLQISTGRTLRYVQSLMKIVAWLEKDLDKADKDDLKAVVAHVHSLDYTEWTRHFYKVTLRKFYAWLHEGEAPELVSWINTSVKVNNNKLPEDLLSQEDVEKLIKVAENPRNRGDSSFVLPER